MITVILDNQPPIYPNTLLQGKVICEFESKTDVRSIKIRCYGKEHTEWRGNSKNHPRYSGTHYFFQMETKLSEPEGFQINAGRYTFPFTFLLPPSLPSTIEFPYGYVRYSLKGIVDIPLAIDPRHRVDIDVISIMDIATLPSNLRLPTQLSEESLMGCCWFFNTEPIKIEAQINKLVFLPGETIKLNLNVYNMSNDTLGDVTVKLIRCFVAHSETPRHDIRYVNEDLLMEKFGGLGAHGEKTYDANLHIPTNIAIPNATGNELIEIIYRIMVSGSTSGLGRNLDLAICEVKIGHVDGANSQVNGAMDQNYGFDQYQSHTSNYPYPSAPAKSKIVEGGL